MKRCRWWAFAAIAALGCSGCSRDATPGPDVPEPPTAASITRDPPASPPPPTAQASASAPSDPPPLPAPRLPPPFVMTELAPTQGDLLTQLKTHVERAKAKKLQPVAEFYADWCPPCREFHKNLEDPALADALRGTYLVKLNMDDWHDHLKNTGFDVRTIPRFFLLGDDGRASGKMLDGDQWGRRPTPQTMAAALNKLLGR